MGKAVFHVALAITAIFVGYRLGNDLLRAYQAANAPAAAPAAQ